jgi:hypothetical protein
MSEPTNAEFEGVRAVLSVERDGEEATLGRDFYVCPNTGEWVYRWADERYVLIATDVLRAQQRITENLAMQIMERPPIGREKNDV